MILHRLGRVSVALATVLTGMTAQAATSVGSVNHDIQFGGTISENVPVWNWNLPQNATRLDLAKADVVNDGTNDTWNILRNHAQPIRFVEGYMEATVPNQALHNLDPDISYLQGSTVVAVDNDARTGSSILTLEATANGDTIANGKLTLTVEPVLLVAKGASTTSTDLVMQRYAGMLTPDTSATTAYHNAVAQLESQLSSIPNATSATYSSTGAAPDFLADGAVHSESVIAGYASTLSKGELSFPQGQNPTSWKSVVTVQVAYK